MLEEPKPEAINERYGTANATLDDVNAVMAASDAIAEPLGSVVRFLIGTGARLSDALRVTWRATSTLRPAPSHFAAEKTQRPQRVAMLAPAIEAIARAGKVKHVGGRVFWQFKERNALQSTGDGARKTFPEGLQKLRLHDCRHLCALFLAAHGASHVELAAQLGHTTLVMVKRYAHLAGGHRGAAHDKLDAAFAEHCGSNAPAKK